MTDLTYRPEVFVRARLDEIDPNDYHDRCQCDLGALLVFGDCSCSTPEMMRRDIEAKRMILDLIQPDLNTGIQVFAPDQEGFERWSKAYLIACALAGLYADHPDYSHKWARHAAMPALPQEET